MAKRRIRDNYDDCPVWAVCAHCRFRTELREGLPEYCPACSVGSLGNRIIRLPSSATLLPQGFLRRGPDGLLYLAVSEETLAWLAVNVLDDPQGSDLQQALIRRMMTPTEILQAGQVERAVQAVSN